MDTLLLQATGIVGLSLPAGRREGKGAGGSAVGMGLERGQAQVWEFSFRRQAAAPGDRQSLELSSRSKSDTSVCIRATELAKDMPFRAPRAVSINGKGSLGCAGDSASADLSSQEKQLPLIREM